MARCYAPPPPVTGHCSGKSIGTCRQIVGPIKNMQVFGYYLGILGTIMTARP